MRLAMVSGVFLTVDWRHMRRVSIEIRPPDSKFLAVIIDPFPQAFTGNASLCTCLGLYAHEVGRKPVAAATARAVERRDQTTDKAPNEPNEGRRPSQQGHVSRAT